MEAFVVVIVGATIPWASNPNMLPIKSSQGIWNVPPLEEILGDFHPLFWRDRSIKGFITILIYDGLAYLRNYIGNSVPGYTEVKGYPDLVHT